MKKYECEPCGYIYDPAVGDPDGGIAPGTAFEDIPDDWVCPCLLYTSPSPRDQQSYLVCRLLLEKIFF